MTTQLRLTLIIGILALAVVACGPTDNTLPTLRPTAGSSSGATTEPTVDPNLGSGFDPGFNEEEGTAEPPPPTPTRESGSGVSGDTESGARGTGVMVQLTGNTTVTEIVDGGVYVCSVAGHSIASGIQPAPNVTFVAPATIEDGGTFNLVGVGDTPNPTSVSVIVMLTAVDDVYDRDVSGTITIDSLPLEDGEFVEGSFDFTIANASGNEVGLSGTFDFEAEGTSFCA